MRIHKRLKIFKKKYKIRQKRRLRTVRKVRKHPAFFVPAITFGVLLTVGILGLAVISRGDPVPQLTTRNSLVVIVNADKKQQVIPTRAKTVGELLKRLDISIHNGDVVEPAVETEIVSDNFRVNVYRAKPITIVDNGKAIRTLSAAATPRSIAKQAGIETYPEDILDLNPANDFVTEGMLGQRLVVDRATPININLYGTQLAVRTQATTVREFLKEKNINLASGETVQPGLDVKLRPDVPIFVNRKGIKMQTVTEDIAAGTKYVDDPNLSFGVLAVRQQGAPGRRVVTYQINIKNGSRKKFNQFVLQKPVPEIVARGTYINIPNDKQAVMAAAGISRSDYMYVDYIVSRESRWNAAATNGSTWGLCQALPGSKMASAGSDWRTNAVTQLRWCSGYASRYGGWAGAYSAWQRQGWW